MRGGMKLLLAFLVAGGMAACDTREDVEMFEGDEAATPAYEETTERSAVITADIEPLDEAEGYENIDGEVRIYETGAAMGATPRADEPVTDADRPAQPGLNRGFEIEVELTGLRQGEEHGWEIRSGTCEDRGQVVVNFSGEQGEQQALAQPLRPAQDGRVMSTATVPTDRLTLDRLEEEDHALHILTQDGTAIACADLDDTLGVF